MEQYISKSALVANIKERIKTYNKGYANGDDSRADALEVLLHDIDIDTLEVKEAIDGYVIEDIEEGNGDFLLSCEYLPKNMGLVDQQKVKVVVIKED